MRLARENDEVVMLGVIQEQHAERCRLFAQWQGFEWPILHDPINQLGLTAVPIVVELDEEGVVKSVRPSVDSVLASLRSDKPTKSRAKSDEPPQRPSVVSLRRQAERADTSQAWIALGDALVVWGEPSADALVATGAESQQRSATAAIAAYKRALEMEPNHADLHFRLGVAYRMRHDARDDSGGPVAKANDFQVAVDHWGKALELEPNQYIYRRRIQQYGPRLIKPYPFYDWVDLARKEIVARGEKPIELAVEPSGAEIAAPAKRFAGAVEIHESPDPQGRIRRDPRGLIRADAVVVPGTVRPGESVRVHVEFRPGAGAVWNNESEPLILWLQLPEGWQSERQWIASQLPENAESNEVRSFEVEIKTPVSQTDTETLEAYALYYVCESSQGTCLYLRQDIEIPVKFSAKQ
jgi:tetratricopeptide (TPR) repeat protein